MADHPHAHITTPICKSLSTWAKVDRDVKVYVAL